MIEKSWILFGILVSSYLACLLLTWGPADARPLILTSLAVIVIFAFDLLLAILEKYVTLRTILLLSVLAGLFVKFADEMIPVCSVIIIILCERYIGGKLFYYPAAILIIMLLLILSPAVNVIILTLLLMPALFIILYSVNRLQNLRLTITQRGEEITALRKSVADQKHLARSVEETVRLKERNRIAARIHDDLGHGISGSILLLEGAMLIMEKDLEKARETIESAADHLRSSVDDIRFALREERSSREEAGLAEIKTELARLSSQHTSIETSLQTEGTLDEVSPVIWYCIHENIKEAITNMLKHSNATKFAVSIFNHNKLLRVELRDNGQAGEYKPGIGLQSMEERCAIHNGSCYFQGREDGFKIVMIFKGEGIIND